MERCTTEALALYLLLVTVGDAEGLSYYSDSTVARLISLDEAGVRKAREVLLSAGLIAYRQPLVQVLGLDHPEPAERAGRCASIGEILRTIGGEG